MGSLQCAEPSAVHANTQPEPANRAAWAVPESRFHRQRHPQHVGADQDDFLIRCLKAAVPILNKPRSLLELETLPTNPSPGSRARLGIAAAQTFVRPLAKTLSYP